jgi:hypothetical protein
MAEAAALNGEGSLVEDVTRLLFWWVKHETEHPANFGRRFIVEFQKFAEANHHPDPSYARWFAKMLELTKPMRVILAFDDWEPRREPQENIKNRQRDKSP